MGRRKVRKATKATTAKLRSHPAINDDKPSIDQELENGNAGEGDIELADGEFIVEEILGHVVDVLQGTIKFKVKWEGYEKKSDQTWEPEDNLKYNPVLGEYLTRIGGRDKIVEGTSKVTLKTRNSDLSVGTRSLPPKRSRKNGDYLGLTNLRARRRPAAWSPPAGSWEDFIEDIDACKDERTGNLVVYLTWKDGRRTKHSTEVVYKRCPQKMLRFYERHVRIIRDFPQVREESIHPT